MLPRKQGHVRPYTPNFTNPLAEAAYQLIKAHQTEIVTIHFIKRTDGTPRRLQGTYFEAGYTRRSWNPCAKNLLCIFDTEKMNYRMVDMMTVDRIVANGVTYRPLLEEAEEITEPASDFVSLRAELQGLFY